MSPTQKEVLAYRSAYGDPRNMRDQTKVSPAWYSANMVKVFVPFHMTMGDIVVRRFDFHKICAPAMQKILDQLKIEAKGNQATLDHWGVTKYSGAHNYRLMRGLDTLSMHSFGCAIDLDGPNNQLGDRTPRFANFPIVLKVFKDNGAKWGGDWNGNGSSLDEQRCDGMHWQFTR